MDSSQWQCPVCSEWMCGEWMCGAHRTAVQDLQLANSSNNKLPCMERSFPYKKYIFDTTCADQHPCSLPSPSHHSYPSSHPLTLTPPHPLMLSSHPLCDANSPSSTGLDKNLNSSREGKEQMSLSVVHPTKLFRLRERDCRALKHGFPVQPAISPETSVWSSPLPLRMRVVRLKTQT